MAEQENENRDSQRRRMLKRGRIMFNGRNSTIDCTIRNLSDTGAKLDVASQIGIPSEFELVIGETMNDIRYAQAVWRRDKSIGVTFV